MYKHGMGNQSRLDIYCQDWDDTSREKIIDNLWEKYYLKGISPKNIKTANWSDDVDIGWSNFTAINRRLRMLLSNGSMSMAKDSLSKSHQQPLLLAQQSMTSQLANDESRRLRMLLSNGSMSMAKDGLSKSVSDVVSNLGSSMPGILSFRTNFRFSCPVMASALGMKKVNIDVTVSSETKALKLYLYV
ncbi:hypothetical protein Tco_0420976 [Tanacetum coccineum]